MVTRDKGPFPLVISETDCGRTRLSCVLRINICENRSVIEQTKWKYTFEIYVLKADVVLIVIIPPKRVKGERKAENDVLTATPSLESVAVSRRLYSWNDIRW